MKRTFFIGAFVAVSAEEVALGLDEVLWKVNYEVRVVIIQGGLESRGGDA